MAFDDEVPTQLIRLDSSPKFVPRANPRPLPRVMSEREVLAEMRAERRSFAHVLRKTMSICLAKARVASLSVADMFANMRGRIVLKGRVRRVREKSQLRIKASYDARIAVQAEVGQRLLVYPELAARPGWIMARTLDGEVGFIRANHLS
jgi:hypothetical protein